MAPKWFKNITALVYDDKMSLAKLLDELFDPQDLWVKSCARHTDNALAEYQRRIVSNVRLDLYPVEGGMELKADLPGMSKEEVNVTVDQNVVTLTGERKNEIDREEGKYHYAERSFGKFTRRVRLPYNADPNTVTAKFDNGVLTVTIPQPESTKAGQILIE